MSKERFIERLCANAPKAESHAEIFALRPLSIDEATRNAKRLINATAEVCKTSLDRADWVTQGDVTLAHLPLGGRAVVYHASGAMQVMTGLATMASLFEKVESRERLQKLVESVAERLGIQRFVQQGGSLSFERLWQIKAAAADRNNKTTEAVLCRAVGAWRQSVGGLPILGGASVAVKVAGGGALDSVAMQLLEPQVDAMERAALIGPDQAAKQVFLQLESLLGRSKVSAAEIDAEVEPLRLGYLHLGKRKTQRVLAPHYVAAVTIRGEEVQAYQFVVPATERSFMPMCVAGSQPPPPQLRRAA